MRSARLSGSLASRERVVRKSSRTSSSIERPCRAARRRSRSLRSSSSRRIVILAITSLCAINDCIKHNAREPSSQDWVSNSLSSALYSPKRRAVQVTVALHDVAITCHQPARGIGTLPRRGASITDASGTPPQPTRPTAHCGHAGCQALQARRFATGRNAADTRSGRSAAGILD